MGKMQMKDDGIHFLFGQAICICQNWPNLGENSRNIHFQGWRIFYHGKSPGKTHHCGNIVFVFSKHGIQVLGVDQKSKGCWQNFERIFPPFVKTHMVWYGGEGWGVDPRRGSTLWNECGSAWVLPSRKFSTIKENLPTCLSELWKKLHFSPTGVPITCNSYRWFQIFSMFCIFTPILWEMIKFDNLTNIFERWVETRNHQFDEWFESEKTFNSKNPTERIIGDPPKKWMIVNEPFLLQVL